MRIRLDKLRKKPCDTWLKLFKDGELNVHQAFQEHGEQYDWLYKNSDYDLIAWQVENNCFDWERNFGAYFKYGSNNSTNKTMTTKVYPVFPVAITEDEFDEEGETSHGGGTVFPEGVVDEEKKAYLFNINGELIQGLVLDDYVYDYIRARLDYPKISARQMKVYLMKPNNLVRDIFYITYYQLLDGMKQVICVVSRKKPLTAKK